MLVRAPPARRPAVRGGRPLFQQLSCPPPSRAPPGASSGVPVRDTRGRGYLGGWWPGRRPWPARHPCVRGQGHRGPARTTAGFQALPGLVRAARRPAAPRAFRAGAGRGQPQACRAMRRRCLAEGYGRRVRGLGFVPTTAANVLQVPPQPARRLAVRPRAAARPGPAVASSGHRGRHPDLSLGWRWLAVPPVVRAAAAALPGSQGRGPARTTTGLRVPPGC
jgi:hypothetical protein